MNLLEIVYKFGLDINKVAYEKGLRSIHHLGVPIICVGNLTMGGTGKTPIVEYIAQYLSQSGKKVTIISRGYKRKTKGNLIVTDGKKIFCSYNDCGDEPYLLAKNLISQKNNSAEFSKLISIIVNKDRYSAGLEAIERFKPDIILLDDGFQHWALKKDFCIVVIDATNPFGNGHLIPLGILREPITALKRANAVILTHTPFAKNLDEIKNKIRSVNSDIPIIESVHQPELLISLKNTVDVLGTSSIKGKRVIAVSAIGNPKSFENTLQSLGVEILYSFTLRDHHYYTQADVTAIHKKCGELNPDFIITTQKDALKLENLDLKSILPPFYALKIKIRFLNDENILDEIIRHGFC